MELLDTGGHGGVSSGTRTMVLLSAGILSGCASSVSCPPAPEGFREVRESEYPESWQALITQFTAPDSVEGDFDGDGRLDCARLFVRATDEGWVVVVSLSSQPGAPVRVTESDARLSREMIRGVEPGVHRTHAYYGIGPGERDTTAVIRLATDAINVSVVESEGSTFVWNADLELFERIAMY